MPQLEQQAKLAADQFRQSNGLGVRPLGNLIELIQQATGYDVAVVDVPATDHGLTMHDPARNKTFIGVARTPHPMRQRSTLAHELAHVIFKDHASDLSSRNAEEIRADAFARHLLIPQEGLTSFLEQRTSADLATLSSVVQWFLVSPHIAAIALRDVGMIPQNTVNDWKRHSTRNLAVRFGWSDYYDSLSQDSNRLRAPQKLVARAISGYATGVLSAQALATLQSTTEQAIVEELHKIGIVPEQPNWQTMSFMICQTLSLTLRILTLKAKRHGPTSNHGCWAGN